MKVSESVEAWLWAQTEACRTQKNHGPVAARGSSINLSRSVTRASHAHPVDRTDRPSVRVVGARMRPATFAAAVCRVLNLGGRLKLRFLYRGVPQRRLAEKRRKRRTSQYFSRCAGAGRCSSRTLRPDRIIRLTTLIGRARGSGIFLARAASLSTSRRIWPRLSTARRPPESRREFDSSLIVTYGSLGVGICASGSRAIVQVPPLGGGSDWLCFLFILEKAIRREAERKAKSHLGGGSRATEGMDRRGKSK